MLSGEHRLHKRLVRRAHASAEPTATAQSDGHGACEVCFVGRSVPHPTRHPRIGPSGPRAAAAPAWRLASWPAHGPVTLLFQLASASWPTESRGELRTVHGRPRATGRQAASGTRCQWHPWWTSGHSHRPAIRSSNRLVGATGSWSASGIAAEGTRWPARGIERDEPIPPGCGASGRTWWVDTWPSRSGDVPRAVPNRRTRSRSPGSLPAEHAHAVSGCWARQRSVVGPTAVAHRPSSSPPARAGDGSAGRIAPRFHPPEPRRAAARPSSEWSYRTRSRRRGPIAQPAPIAAPTAWARGTATKPAASLSTKIASPVAAS